MKLEYIGVLILGVELYFRFLIDYFYFNWICFIVNVFLSGLLWFKVILYSLNNNYIY